MNGKIGNGQIGWSARHAAALMGLAAVMLSGCGHALPPAAAESEVRVGYGEQSQRNVTGAITTLTAEDLEHRHVGRVEELLNGHLAGVQVIPTPGGGFSVRIRGITSIYGSNEPLYVVDGVIVRTFPGRGLYWLSPADIERIDVLKDAGATAIYGMRGANGVVLITTRHSR